MNAQPKAALPLCIATTQASGNVASQATATPVIESVLQKLLHTTQWLKQIQRTLRERTELAAMDDRGLHDLGIDRIDATTESQRGLFDLPTEPAVR